MERSWIETIRRGAQSLPNLIPQDPTGKTRNLTEQHPAIALLSVAYYVILFLVFIWGVRHMGQVLTKWTKVETNTLKRLWRGHSIMEIVLALHELCGIKRTYDAVGSQAHRLHLVRQQPVPIRMARQKRRAGKPRVKEARSYCAAAIDYDFPEERCRWPIGHPGEPGFHFCGEQAKGRHSYCDEHCRRAYTPRKLLDVA